MKRRGAGHVEQGRPWECSRVAGWCAVRETEAQRGPSRVDRELVEDLPGRRQGWLPPLALACSIGPDH